jgi:hypothetical protein
MQERRTCGSLERALILAGWHLPVNGGKPTWSQTAAGRAVALGLRDRIAHAWALHCRWGFEQRTVF